MNGPELNKNTKIADRYILKEFKGSGSFGEVWLAEDTSLGIKGNNQTSISASFSADGGSKSYTTSTDGDGWSTWGAPNFRMITNRTTSSLTLQCEPGTSSTPRSDYMKIMSGEKEVRIDISQVAAGPSAKIVSINQTHNVINGYVKGMNIVLKVETSRMKNKRATATAWFSYADNTTQLNNGYGGQVHISKSDTAPYEETTFTMTLFLPYTSLKMARGGNGTSGLLIPKERHLREKTTHLHFAPFSYGAKMVNL